MSGSRGYRAIGAVALLLLCVAIWDKRGAAVGIVALVVYAPIAVAGAVVPRRTAAWSQRHVVLDTLVVVPLAFLAVAYLTDLPLTACGAIAAAVGALLVPLALRRRRAVRRVRRSR